MSSQLTRKTTRRELVTKNYHGTIVADPYHWLNDDTSDEVKQWTQDQNNDFYNYINSFEVKNDFKNYLTKTWNYEKCNTPEKSGDYYYTWRNSGLQNQSVLYRSTNPAEKGELVFDPNTLSDDGTIAVTSTTFSPNGNYLVYGLSNSGSDWKTFYVLDLKTLETLPDKLEYIKFTTADWLPDESGFFYSCFPTPSSTQVLESDNKNSMVKLHILGDEQSNDKLIHQDKDNPDWLFTLTSDENKKYSFLSIFKGSGNKNHLYYRPFNKIDSPWITIADNFDDVWYIFAVINNTAYISTDKDAPNIKIMSAELSEDGISNWKTIMPEGEEAIDDLLMVNNQILTITLYHVSHEVDIYDLNGAFVKEIPLPTVGSITSYFAKQQDKEIFMQFTSVLYPNTVLKYDFETETMTTIFTPKIDFNFNDYETIQEFTVSKDGTKVPMFITKRKDLVKDGSNKTYLYGYGGFNINMTPSFSPPILAWLEKGGVYVTACTRGGGEYGEEWHRAGMLESKQDVFDDFISIAEHLINKNYTTKEKIGIHGGSNGGLLTGACLTQRPELFGAVAIHVPVLDMLNYHRFTIGRYWISEYGNADNSEHFPFLYEYSPLHNVKMNTVYPPTIILTADTDDRVVPSHARKFAATLQAADAGNNPILLRTEKSAGHGLGKPISKLIEERADLLTFLYVNLS